ncbi:MAG: 3'-5' exonuclease [Rhodospirillales bacterium]|nr:3'-5' exonuclease [Rhodospirillales bacterium]
MTGSGLAFVALDVETANADAGSICQIGLAIYEGGRLVDEWSTLVDPEAHFDPRNIAIHGIDEYVVTAAPTFRQCASDLTRFLSGCVVVHHTAFDRHALRRACLVAEMPFPSCTWLDSARVARRAWPQFARRGYALGNVSRYLNYRYRAHDALEDAKAAGHLVLAACRETGLDVPGWLDRLNASTVRRQPSRRQRVRRRERPSVPGHTTRSGPRNR